MQIGMIGLGRMGSGLARRLMKRGHDCVAYDVHAAAVARLRESGAIGTDSIGQFMESLAPPRTIWMMVPAGAVDSALTDLCKYLTPGDIVIDGGNSHYRDSMRRAAKLRGAGVHFVDAGTSGGIAGEERGFCLMLGGESDIIEHLRPVFLALAPGVDSAARTPGSAAEVADAEHGFLHCGGPGAGHFVKMVHNGIEYGLMGAYAEGFNILRHAGIGREEQPDDAGSTPLRDPEFYRYALDLAQIAEVWRRGSVIGSWLLDLTAAALRKDPQLDRYGGHVPDSGEGRWTQLAAIDTGVPTPVLSAALNERFASRGRAAPANKILSAMRDEFGGHAEAATG